MIDKRSIGFGIALIILGLILFLHSLGFWIFHWSLILILLGGSFLFAAFFSRQKGTVFPGTLLLLLGLFFYLRYDGLLYDPMYYQWPIFPTIVGVAFLVTYIFNPEDWGLLIPAGILIIVGLLFLADNYRILRIDMGELVSTWWPLILVVIGLKLIFERKLWRK